MVVRSQAALAMRIHVDASEQFLAALAGLCDPEDEPCRQRMAFERLPLINTS
jgi:hypothetical protein